MTAGGITGTVMEIGLFATTINTPDNVLTLLGNGKIFGDIIQNYTHNPFRRVELKCQLASSADHVAAMQLLREKLAGVPNVLPQPAVEVEILEFNLVGPVLAVRPFCHNDHYWQVYFDGAAPSGRHYRGQVSHPRCRHRWFWYITSNPELLEGV